MSEFRVFAINTSLCFQPFHSMNQDIFSPPAWIDPPNCPTVGDRFLQSEAASIVFIVYVYIWLVLGKSESGCVLSVLVKKVVCLLVMLG